MLSLLRDCFQKIVVIIFFNIQACHTIKKSKNQSGGGEVSFQKLSVAIVVVVVLNFCKMTWERENKLDVLGQVN